MGKRDKRRPVLPEIWTGCTDPQAFWSRLRQYVSWCEVQQVAERTLLGRVDALLAFFRWCEERSLCYPGEVTRPVLERYQHHLHLKRKPDGEPLSVATQRNHITAIQGYYRWLMKQGWLLSNPAADLDLPKLPHRLPKDVLNIAEVERVLAVPDVSTPAGLRDRALLELLYSTGIRRAELQRLTLSSINRDSRTLMVRQGKGRKDRLLPVGERALRWLDAWLTHGRPEMTCGKRREALFLANDGEALSLSGLSRLVRGWLVASGVRELGGCHLLRHTMATLMLENGADTRWIQVMLGHSKLETTQIYTRVSVRALREIHRATHPAEQQEPDETPDVME
ncbi:site-specific tyrosine recombinase XerC [Erwinia mallotivora]|uniref:site-specific tyrosine recombinase XerC n=1 Tax=Erwinia mallotivora TaxID=69222 RepID=UPI0035EDA64C